MSELWYVKLPDGDVASLTLDELDEAFQAGTIDPRTMVLPAGATQWALLGELAGLDQPASPPAAGSPVRRGSPPVLPNSMRPVSVDLGIYGEDFDEALRPRKNGRRWIWGVALVLGVVGLAGFEAQRAGAISLGRLALAVAHPASPSPAAPPVATPPADPPIVPATPTPVAPGPSGSVSATSPLTDVSHRFTPEQRDKLAAADKLREQKAKSRSKARAASPPPRTGPKPKSQGFTTNGNK